MSIKRADKFSIVSTTIENARQAEKLSRELVERKLCACVHIIPKITSIYFWKGKIQKSQECWMVMKTHQAKFRELVQILQRKHPYELPEIVEIKLDHGSQSYLDWIMTSLKLVP